LNTLLQQATEFRTVFQVSPTFSQNGRLTQKSLIDEEWSEFHEAFHHEPLDHVLKELADLVYVCYQYAAHEGWDLDEAMNRLHESNLSKLDENGDPIFRADGKVLKGPNYQPPYLGDLIK
jgi:predicted HAD superfamily Cof-like phosphohydrolase